MSGTLLLAHIGLSCAAWYIVQECYIGQLNVIYQQDLVRPSSEAINIAMQR